MEVFDLSMDSILDASELETSTPPKEEPKQEPENKEQEEKKEEIIDNNITEVLDAEQLGLESVGNESEKDNGSTKDLSEGSSPNTYSSIASAFKVDGVPLFSDADNEELEKIQSVDDFEDFVKAKLEETIESRLGEAEKRINDALTYGMQPSDIQVFENSIKNLNAIKEEDIEAESEEGENLRKQLIYTDLINRGYSEAVAKKKTQQSFDAATDIDDARDALESNKTFYKSEYDKAFNEKKKEYDSFVEKRKQDAEKLKKSILEDEKGFGEIKVDKTTRQKIYNALNKPVGKDSNNNPISELQKYADENPVEFRKYMAYFFVVTDGFKSLDKVKDSVRKEVTKKQISALERTLNSTARNSNGSLKLVGGSPQTFGSGEQPWQIEL